MIIAEFTVDSPVLRVPRERLPDLHVQWTQTYVARDGTMHDILWVKTADVEAFEAAVADDPGLRDPSLLTTLGDHRLYRFRFTARGREANLYQQIVEVGGILPQAVLQSDGWRIRVQLPDNHAYEQIYQFCRDQDMPFTFHSIYERHERPVGGALSLTDAQVETLVEAVDSGYLAIPRQCSLAELGDRLGISESAASERFRRAVRALVQQTVYDGELS